MFQCSCSNSIQGQKVFSCQVHNITISNTLYFVLFILSSVSSVRQQSSVAENIIYLDNLTLQQGQFQLAENLLI